MSDSLLLCKCGATLKENDFRHHYLGCTDFKKTFEKFDNKISELFKIYTKDKDNLKLLKFLLKNYINLIQNQIETFFPTSFQQGKNKANSENANKLLTKDNKTNVNKNACQICGSPNIQYLECFHPICEKCFIEYAEKDFPNMKCKICEALIGESLKKMILKAKYEDLDLKFSIGSAAQIIECPQCKEKNTFEEGVVDYNIKDNDNNVISKEAAEHYAKYRCRCFHCKIDFCTNCRVSPYHFGKTCDEFKNFVESVRCRYCNEVIKFKNKGPNADCCNNKECVDKFNISCTKNLHCGHRCFGCKTETACPPCLLSKCPEFVNTFDQDADTYCSICFTEGLSSAPIVELKCKHFVHYECLLTRLNKKWIGPKITFNHCLCPSCNEWADCPNVPDIQAIIEENRKLYEKIKDMALKRLAFEGLDKDERLTDKNSKWYGKKAEYAMNRLCYYMCYKCHCPYFAGRRECGDGPMVNNDDPNNNYDPKELICGKHVDGGAAEGVKNCKIHGKEFIEYKCRFCCKISSWFCWGTTHFCDDCHKRQCAGEYLTKMDKSKLPVCNPKTCEVGGHHPPNGVEYALGCSVCRNQLENVKNF